MWLVFQCHRLFLPVFPWMLMISFALDDLAGKGEMRGRGTVSVTVPSCSTASGHLPVVSTASRERRHSSSKISMKSFFPNAKFAIS